MAASSEGIASQYITTAIGGGLSSLIKTEDRTTAVASESQSIATPKYFLNVSIYYYNFISLSLMKQGFAHISSTFLTIES